MEKNLEYAVSLKYDSKKMIYSNGRLRRDISVPASQKTKKSASEKKYHLFFCLTKKTLSRVYNSFTDLSIKLAEFGKYMPQ